MFKSYFKSREWRGSVIVLIVGLTLAAMLSPEPVQAQVTGISYTLTPIGEVIRFEDDAALKNSFFYGGKLGFGFGEFIELNGLYLFSSDSRTELGNLTMFDDATTTLLSELPSRSLKIHRFGGELKFNMGRDDIFPFVTLGAGALRFEPEDLNKSTVIYLSGGLGLQFSPSERYTIVLQATGLTYRYNPAASLMSSADIAAIGKTTDDFDLIDVRNFAGSVGVKFYLGGRARGSLSDIDRAFQDQFSRGWRGIDFRLEPAVGEINFNNALGYRRHSRFASVSAGIDLGAYAGLRAFYLRGVEDDSWSKFDDLQAYGGELKLAFAEGSGNLVPYFTFGGGYLDVMTGYAGNGLAVAEDRPFAFGGVGLIVPLGSAISIDASVRSLLMSTSGVDNVSDPGNIETNTMYAVGISFGLGGGRTGTVLGREMTASKLERERLATDVSAMEQELRTLKTRMDSITAAADGWLVNGTDSIAAPTAAPARAKESADGTRWVTLPVPEEGELYLRFGTPGGVSVETIDGEPVTYYLDPTTGTLMLAAPPAGQKPSAPQGAPATPVTVTTPPTATAPATAIQKSPAAPVVEPESLESVIRRVMREERASQAPAAQPPTMMEQRETKPIVIEVPAAEAASPPKPAERAAETMAVESAPSEPSMRFAALSPLIGYNFNTPHQGLVGLRADFVHRTRPYRLLPEIILGFGGDETTANVNLNGVYDLDVAIMDRAYPYGGIGIGLLNRDKLEFVLNLVIGADIQIETSTLFLEYVNQNFFDNNRLLAGYRFSF